MASLVDDLNIALTSNSSYGSCVSNAKGDMGEVCTFCVTGTNPMYQGIYQCITCNKATNKSKSSVKNKSKKASKNASNQCVCLGCSKQCHRGHKLEFIAYGKAYCDCGCNGCQLLSETRIKCGVNASNSSVKDTQSSYKLKSNRYPFGVHQIRPNMDKLELGGEDDYLFDMLRKECMAIVTQSKETFWIGSDWKFSHDQCGPEDKRCRCLLEDLALMIFKYHTEKVEGGELDEGTAGIGDVSYGNNTGLEWWIQIKDLNESSSDVVDEAIGSITGPTIELHYDKDEVMADVWGIGKFPTLGTVTYLSTSRGIKNRNVPPQPTVIYSNTAGDEVGNPIRDCYISYPRIGKHVCFDGNLLHGAFSDSKLAHWEQNEIRNSDTLCSKGEDNVYDRYRFTFLVNIWLDHHPNGIEPLPDKMLNKIYQIRETDEIDERVKATELFEIQNGNDHSVLRVDVDTNEALDYDKQVEVEGGLAQGVADEEVEDDIWADEEDANEDIEQFLNPGYQVIYAPFIPPPVENGSDAGELEEVEAMEPGLVLRMILPPLAACVSSDSEIIADNTDFKLSPTCSSYHIHYLDDDCAAVLQNI